MAVTQSPKNNVIQMPNRLGETRDQALDRLFREHSAAVRAFLLVRLRVGQEELDDVIQEVFARVARMDDLLEKLPPENKSARSFLFSIANRLVVDMERRKVVRSRYLEQEAQRAAEERSADIVTPEDLVLAREDLELVKHVLAEMKPPWRQAFILSRLKHKGYQEIAEAMEVSRKTVEKYIGHALARMRDALLDARGEK